MICLKEKKKDVSAVFEERKIKINDYNFYTFEMNLIKTHTCFFINMNMKATQGLSVTRIVKEIKKNKKNVIFLVNLTEKETVEYYKKLGVDYFCTTSHLVREPKILTHIGNVFSKNNNNDLYDNIDLLEINHLALSFLGDKTSTVIDFCKGKNFKNKEIISVIYEHVSPDNKRVFLSRVKEMVLGFKED